MSKRAEIIAAAERVFEDQGFRGTSVDRILAPSGASTRTLYKHFGSREELVLAVLQARHLDFMARLGEWEEPDNSVDHLFDVQAQWMAEHGARGCMLLRAYSEYAGANPDIVDLVQRQKQEFEREIAKRVEAELKRVDTELATQIWLLFEGAVAAASVSEQPVLRSARRAASVLVKLAKQSSP